MEFANSPSQARVKATCAGSSLLVLAAAIRINVQVQTRLSSRAFQKHHRRSGKMHCFGRKRCRSQQVELFRQEVDVERRWIWIILIICAEFYCVLIGFNSV